MTCHSFVALACGAQRTERGDVAKMATRHAGSVHGRQGCLPHVKRRAARTDAPLTHIVSPGGEKSGLAPIRLGGGAECAGLLILQITEVVEIHPNLAAAKLDAFGFQSQPLFERAGPLQRDSASRRHDTMPRQPLGGMRLPQRPPDLTSRTGRIGRESDVAVGGHAAFGYGADNPPDRLQTGFAARPASLNARHVAAPRTVFAPWRVVLFWASLNGRRTLALPRDAAARLLLRPFRAYPGGACYPGLRFAPPWATILRRFAA